MRKTALQHHHHVGRAREATRKRDVGRPTMWTGHGHGHGPGHHHHAGSHRKGSPAGRRGMEGHEWHPASSRRPRHRGGVAHVVGRQHKTAGSRGCRAHEVCGGMVMHGRRRGGTCTWVLCHGESGFGRRTIGDRRTKAATSTTGLGGQRRGESGAV